jgi:hypothetical protein
MKIQAKSYLYKTLIPHKNFFLFYVVANTKKEFPLNISEVTLKYA